MFYIGTVFLPSIPKGTKMERRIKLPWRRADDVGSQRLSPGDGSASEEFENIIDQSVCIITLSEAPGVKLD
jgi:hypothetical protein